MGGNQQAGQAVESAGNLMVLPKLSLKPLIGGLLRFELSVPDMD